MKPEIEFAQTRLSLLVEDVVNIFAKLIVQVFLVSSVCQAQSLTMAQPGLWPGNRVFSSIGSRKLLDTLSEGVQKAEAIEKEAQERKTLFSPSEVQKSFRQIQSERQNRIRELRQEIIDSRSKLGSNSDSSLSALESELAELLTKRTEVALSGELNNPVEDLLDLNLGVREEQAGAELNFEGPGMWTAPAGGNDGGSGHGSLEADSEAPEEFYCPISRELMEDPVVAADGFSYERVMIEQWINQNRAGGSVNSPKTGAALSNYNLMPNLTLRNMIQALNFDPASSPSNPPTSAPALSGAEQLAQSGCDAFGQVFKASFTLLALGMTGSFNPVNQQETSSPAARVSGNVARTIATMADPLARAGDWYKGPRAAQAAGALEWELGRKNSKVTTFEKAQEYAASRAGEGWRLPTIYELEALYQQRAVLGGDLETGCFWSDTSVVGFPSRHWCVNFGNGNMNHCRDMFHRQVWLVRDGEI